MKAHILVRCIALEKTLTDYERGFLEATIDFEGSLTVRRLKSTGRYSHGYAIAPMGFVSNTNIELLEKVQTMMGCGSIVVHQRYKNNEDYKPSYRYNFTRPALRCILPQIVLVEKKRQKEIVVKVLDIIKNGGKYYPGKIMPGEVYQELDQMVDEIRSLNNRGLNAALNRQRAQKNKPA